MVSRPCLSSKAMLLGLVVEGPAGADDNRGEVDVVGLITYSHTKPLPLTDAATLPVSALTPSFVFLVFLVFYFTFFQMLLSVRLSYPKNVSVSLG